MSEAILSIDVARVELLLNELRLPGVKAIWPKIAAQSDKEGWPAARFLAALAEHEAADRTRRRIERHMVEARLPAGKTLAAFDFENTPMVSKAQVMALAAGDVWLRAGANLLMFGPPGGGKSHLTAAIGLALVESGWRVLFQRATDLAQRLQTARRELALEAYIAKLDRYDLLILDDIAYVSKDRDETSVLFELIAARYERRSRLKLGCRFSSRLTHRSHPDSRAIEGLISAALASRPHPEQGFGACLGILRSCRGLDAGRVEVVSARAVELGVLNGKGVAALLARKTDAGAPKLKIARRLS
jgi:DNA replication protein DnaC